MIIETWSDIPAGLLKKFKSVRISVFSGKSPKLDDIMFNRKVCLREAKDDKNHSRAFTISKLNI